MESTSYNCSAARRLVESMPSLSFTLPPIKDALFNSGKLLQHSTSAIRCPVEMFTKIYALPDKGSPIEMFSDVHKEIYSECPIECSEPHKGEAWRGKRSLTDTWVILLLLILLLKSSHSDLS